MADPVLRNWRLIAGDETVRGILVGEVSGHPLLSDGWITTSVVAEIARDRSWARTASRRYTLGAALPDDQPLPPAATNVILNRLVRNMGMLPGTEIPHRLLSFAERLSLAPSKTTS